MLRALALLLLLANLGFHAWTQGWLSPWLPPPGSDREPQRLAAQLHPERIAVLSDRAASAALAAAQSAAPHEEPALLCLEAGPFDEAGARAAEALLAEHGVPPDAVTRELVARNQTWGVVIGRFADRDAMRARAEELARLELRSEELSTPPALVPGLRLGNYSDRFGAEAALAALVAKGVDDARVVPLPLGATQQWLRAVQADAELQTRLKSLPAERFVGGFKPCIERTVPSPG